MDSQRHCCARSSAPTKHQDLVRTRDAQKQAFDPSLNISNESISLTALDQKSGRFKVLIFTTSETAREVSYDSIDSGLHRLQLLVATYFQIGLNAY